MAIMMHVFVLHLLCLQATLALQVGNFPQSSIPSLYEPKLSLDVSADIYARIFSRYDIITLPSISNTTRTRINMAIEQLSSSYDLYMSSTMFMEGLELLGPEQCGIAYRRDVVTVSDFLRHQPTGILAMRVRVNLSGQEFVLAVPHLPGDDVLHLLELLPHTYDTFSSIYNLENVLFSGDFNTFYAFMTEEESDALTVSTNDTFQWFINYDDDTFINDQLTGAPSRFLAAGDIKNWVVPNSAKIFDFRTYFGLSNDEASGMVFMSPIELELIEPIGNSH